MAAPEHEAAGTAATQARPYRHVMLAVDPSDASRHAAVWAATHGVVSSAGRTSLVSVVPSPPLAPMAPGIAGVGGLAGTAGVAEYEKEWQATREVHRHTVDDIYNDLLRRKCVTPDTCARVLLDGDGAGGGAVADPLVGYAKDKSVDHVVIGSRGLSAFKRGLYTLIGLGSVSDHMVRHAPCPVTVVPHGAQLDPLPGPTAGQP